MFELQADGFRFREDMGGAQSWSRAVDEGVTLGCTTVSITAHFVPPEKTS